MDVINELILQAVSSPWLYLVMLLTAAIDGVFPPIPSETVLVAAAAVAVATGETNMPLLIGAAALGAMIGDNFAYTIGRSLGVSRYRWMKRPKVAAGISRAQKALTHNGVSLILGARYIPVGRVTVNLSAGALGYPRGRFLAVSAAGGVSWAIYSAVVGIVAGSWFTEQPLLSGAAGIIFALVLGIIVDRIATFVRQRKDKARDTLTVVETRVRNESQVK